MRAMKRDGDGKMARLRVTLLKWSSGPTVTQADIGWYRLCDPSGRMVDSAILAVLFFVVLVLVVFNHLSVPELFSPNSDKKNLSRI